MEIDKLTVVVEACHRQDLNTRCVNKKKADTMVFSPVEPKQFNRDEGQKTEKFMFFMEARKFYFGFFLREFDIDLLVKL